MTNHTKKIFGLITLILAGTISTGTTHAVTFQQDIGVSFTFNSSIAVSLSSNNLVISDLTPGTASDSNVIMINIKTNNVTGYTLNATVGDDEYNSTDLKHQSSTISNKFTSLDFGSSVATNTSFSDNTWGYSYREAGDWHNYSGLPLYNDTINIATLKQTAGPVSNTAGDNIEFKIAARAAENMPSGTYNNVINFTAVANHVPKTLEMAYADAGMTKLNGYYKMQDMSSAICDAAEIIDEGSQMQAIDIRDNKVYWITKLRDGKCWFTQNLDHDIVAQAGYYTHANTDLGYGTNTNQSWTPDKSTYTTGTATWNTSSTGYNNQQSYDPGNKIWDGTLDDSFSTTLDNMAQGNNTHYHLGNYYNWGAAVAMNDTSAYTTKYQDPDQSICPAGWTLPKGGNINQGAQTQPGSFQYLVDQYGWASDGYYMMDDPYIWEAPIYFSLGGNWSGESHNVASNGGIWSSVVYGSYSAYALRGYYEKDISLENDYNRYSGYSVRCVSR